MNQKALWVSWYGLLLVCALYGLLPEPQGFWRVLGIVLSVTAFVPAGLLLKLAWDKSDLKTLRLVRRITIISLSVTVGLYMLNVLSVFMSPVWGDICHVLLVLGSTPMFCAQYWILGLFLWSALLWTATLLLKEKAK